MITRRFTAMTVFLAVLVLLSLSLGSGIYLYAAALIGLILLFSAVSAAILKATLRVDVRVREEEIPRCEKVHMSVEVSQRCPFPASNALVRVIKGGKEEEILLPIRPFRADSMGLTAPAPHVGNQAFSVVSVTVSDFFSLLDVRVRPAARKNVLVLPRPFDIEKPTFLVGDEGRAALKLSQEDNTSPEDVRAYVPGDALKRVHWKLSARKGEVMVRRYETPAPPDTLILTDNARPEGGADDESTAVLRDLVCETCAAVADLQLRDASPVRVPMYGDAPGEFTADTPAHSLLLQEMLARQSFDSDFPFERVLRLELRRMRRTGAVIVITTRLSPAIVEGIICIRRMGPSVRLYLASLKTDEEKVRELVSRLQRHLVEVCYVTPA